MRNAVCILAIVVAGTFVSCSRTPQASTVETKSAGFEETLLKAVALKRTTSDTVIIDMKAISDFQWDTLYVLSPYTTEETIKSRLGAAAAAGVRTDIAMRDDINVLVFVGGSKVVKQIDHPRSQGDFADSEVIAGFPASRAVFEVRADNKGESWLVLHPVIESGINK